ncbi:cardiolipin synthase [Rhizobium sp. TH2]|uniref:cardiolipin synthase n=1 Tax=Rhizobium sp. TH2 TaxID=2775403 RepID=UPI0021580619|nr:cardiolipin synthase [Rhizobium sp. TH2]UVC07184.1 cardiolipin synthase [Rhizobium sp. TH2]
MIEFLSTYWPHFLAALSIVIGTIAASHAAMTKEDVRAATGWVGIILLSPIVGAIFYSVAGVNRIRHTALATRRSARHALWREFYGPAVPRQAIADCFSTQFLPMKTLGDTVTRFPLTSGNNIQMLHDGDEAYAQICEAIEKARHSILLETYIFDRDRIGTRIADLLIAAKERGVTVRVLIDSVGARYSVPSIVRHLRAGGVNTFTFNGKVITGLRLPYANLRTHRKIIVIDDEVAFTGGMNIREAFTREFHGDNRSLDTHFRVTGPVVGDLFAVAAEDWHFASGEKLAAASDPHGAVAATDPIFVRVVSSGPDGSIETNHKMLIGAFSVAQKSVRIMSPYFLPDRELISAMVTAARRGVEIDILLPSQNNLKLVDHAMTAQFDQVLKGGCRIWRVNGAFDHSKLMTIDGQWSYVGSSNLDPRSLRLNFEVDLEVLDSGFASMIEDRIDRAMQDVTEVTLHGLRRRPFLLRLVEKILWLGSPYL